MRLRSLLCALIVHQSGSLVFGGNLGEHNVELEVFREVEVGMMIKVLIFGIMLKLIPTKIYRISIDDKTRLAQAEQH